MDYWLLHTRTQRAEATSQREACREIKVTRCLHMDNEACRPAMGVQHTGGQVSPQTRLADSVPYRAT